MYIGIQLHVDQDPLSCFLIVILLATFLCRYLIMYVYYVLMRHDYHVSYIDLIMSMTPQRGEQLPVLCSGSTGFPLCFCQRKWPKGSWYIRGPRRPVIERSKPLAIVFTVNTIVSISRTEKSFYFVTKNYFSLLTTL